MGVGIVLVVYLTVRRLFDRPSALFSALIVGLYYPLIYYAHNANVDVPYLFWALLGIYFFVGVIQQGQVKDYVLFAFFGTLAICTKDQAYGLFLLSPLAILWIRATEPPSATGQQSNWMKVLWDRRLHWAAVVTVVTLAIGHNLLFNFSGFLNHVYLITGRGSLPYADYPATFLGLLHLLGETLWQLSIGLTPPIFFLCIAGSVYCAYKFPRFTLPVMFLGLSYYASFINVVRYVPIRFVLPLGIILAFFGGKLIADLWQPGRWQRLRRISVCVVFSYSALFAIQLDLLLLNDPRYAAEQWLRRNVEQGAVVETFAPRDTSFKHYPRFPLGAKIRASKLEEGTRWVIREVKPDRKILLNLYEGREAADYVVFSKYWYRALLAPEVQESNEGRVLRDFFEGRTKYQLAAVFETPTFVPIVGLPINPRIDIFKARDTTSNALTR
jgi:4-amino-4-deoxy-L-arabinose transferase-like glycosyltransferase